MSDVLTLERVSWELQDLKSKYATEMATRNFVSAEIQSATKPINDALVKMERSIERVSVQMEKLGEQSLENKKSQEALMQDRAEREKSEYDARMQRQQEKHAAELKVLEANLEDAKNQSFLARVTKQYQPVLIFLATCAVVYNQVIYPAIHAMQSAKP